MRSGRSRCTTAPRKNSTVVASTARFPDLLNDLRQIIRSRFNRDDLLKCSRERAGKQSHASIQIPGYCALSPGRHDADEFIDEKAIDLKKSAPAYPVVFACRAIVQSLRAPTLQAARASRSPLRSCGRDQGNVQRPPTRAPASCIRSHSALEASLLLPHKERHLQLLLIARSEKLYLDRVPQPARMQLSLPLPACSSASAARHSSGAEIGHS